MRQARAARLAVEREHHESMKHRPDRIGDGPRRTGSDDALRLQRLDGVRNEAEHLA